MLSSCGERAVTLCLERFAFRQLSGCLIGSGFEAGYGGSDLPAVSHWKEKFSLVFGFYQGTSGPGSLLVGTRVMQVQSQRFVTCGKEQHWRACTIGSQVSAVELPEPSRSGVGSLRHAFSALLATGVWVSPGQKAWHQLLPPSIYSSGYLLCGSLSVLWFL